MKSYTRLSLIAFLLTAVVLSAVPAVSAVKKAPPKRVVKGTTQLKGDQAKLGVTYTLGKRDPINVTLDRAEYSVEPVRFGNGYVYPNSDQKMLVLHYTLHNPNSKNRGLSWNTIEITAVDANDKNWRFATNTAIEGTGEKCVMSLKPAQKTKIYTCIIVPAKGEIPKVIFEAPDKLVLRYDLRGKVKPLPAPIADPSDPSGATALEKVPAEMGVFYPMKSLQFKIESAQFSTASLAGAAPRKGFRYLIVTAAAKNPMINKDGMRWSTFTPKLTDIDNAEIRWDGQTYYGSRDDSVNSDIEPGQELRFRHIFKVPENVQLKELAVSQSGSRSYVYDMSEVK
ncbi:MAG: hypothetical protein ACYC27_06695 [Armatimonadota bacterium]